MSSTEKIEIIEADLSTDFHQKAVVTLLNAYASDPMGDGKELSNDVKERLISGLREHPTTHVFLAIRRGEPVGIAACFRGFSTFAARPLLNIHDIYVVPEVQGQGVGRLLLEHVERAAKALDCCKLTLEVQERNARAHQIYLAYGFSRTTYVEAAGAALFLSKTLE